MYSKGKTKPIIVSKSTVAEMCSRSFETMCSNNDLCSYCYNSAPWPIVATVYSNNYLGSDCYVTVFQQQPIFLLLQECVRKMTPGHAGCVVPRKNTIERHGRAHKELLSHGRA